MIYNIYGDRWEYLVFTPLKFKQEDFRETQNRIFDELDDRWINRFGVPYFIIPE